jgi:hypothetical protein
MRSGRSSPRWGRSAELSTKLVARKVGPPSLLYLPKIRPNARGGHRLRPTRLARAAAVPSAAAIFVFLHSGVMCLSICPPTTRCQMDKECFSTAIPTMARSYRRPRARHLRTSPEPSASVSEERTRVLRCAAGAEPSPAFSFALVFE